MDLRPGRLEKLRKHYNKTAVKTWSARLLLLGIVVITFFSWRTAKLYASPYERIWHDCGRGQSRVEPSKLDLDKECLANKLEKLVDKLGVNESLNVVVKIGEKLPSGECHFTSHMVGWAAFRKFGSPARALQEYRNETACSVGYSHGVVEEFLKDRPGVPLSEVSGEVCDAPEGTPMATTGGQWQCTHGFGHVVMAFTDYNLPESISVCDTFPDENRRYGCGYGVFMENILAGHFRQGVASDWVKKEDPLYPCLDPVVPERYQKPCFEWAPTQITRYQTRDGFEGLKICMGLLHEAQQRACLMGMGREMGTTLNAAPSQIAGWCTSVPNQYQEFCLDQTMQNYVTTPDRLPRGIALCNVVTTSLQRHCSSLIGIRLSWLVRDSYDRKRWCSELRFDNEECISTIERLKS